MKRILFLVLPLFCSALVFFGFVVFVAKGAASKGALQVTSVPKSNVYLNGKLLGETPLCKCEGNDMLPSGEYSLKVVTADSAQPSYEERITIGKQTLTVVDRTFDGSSSSEGSFIYLKELADQQRAELFVTSFPAKADVLLDKSIVGQTPLFLKKITAADHEIVIRKAGYRSKILHLHTTAGYQLYAIGYLGVDLAKKTQGQEEANALNVLLPSLSPSITPSPTATPAAKTQVVILPTDIGYVRVRSEATVASTQSGQVKPGELYDLLDEKSGWYQIKLSDGTVGWVSAQYTNKKE